MPQKTIVIDTSILCVYLQIPHMETCGKAPDVWNYDDVKTLIDLEAEADSLLVLPLATIVETGNHIAQLANNRRPYAEAFSDIIRASVNDENPWTAFSAQVELWNDQNLLDLAENFVDYAERGLGIGDATIVDVAKFYAAAGHEVKILTGDGSLKGYEPAPVSNPFRRDRKKR
jgi:hypothetical protein